MATKRSQKIFIWAMAVVMLVGTIGTYAALILSNQNASVEQEKLRKAQDTYMKEYKEYQKKTEAQGAELSKKYYDTFKQYESRVGTFDSKVTELKKEDLAQGSGDEVKKDSTFYAYYLGWTPDGKVFDGSIDGDKLKAPFKVQSGGVITGWTEGAEGMKKGGVRLLTIPAEKAYGKQGSGEKIPPNTPLTFVIMVIEDPEEIKEPTIPQELLQNYGS